MANRIYTHAKFLAWTKQIDMENDDVRAILLRGYTFSDSHDYLDDIGGGLRVATSGTILGGTMTGSLFDTDGWTWTAVPAGAACESFVMYIHTGVEGTSPLICYIDTATILPVTPTGVDINVLTPSGIWQD